MSRPPGARTVAVALLVAAACASCAWPTPYFSTSNARAHVTQLAGAIGARPAGSDANRRAREYLVEQLRFYGFTVRVQEAEARRPELGLTAHVQNIIAVHPGAIPDAMGLIAHYDSVPIAPGAGDDAFGVAVSLEVGRLLAARKDRRHSLMVLLTDAEENGLMGAAALVQDPEVRARLRTYINIEATGADAPAMLFETGPGNGWLVRAFARAAPAPRGGSISGEIYKRLPNDTDFSVLKRTGVPGLNIAAIGDSYAYHTPQDIPERLTDDLLSQTGENVLATMTTLDGMDLGARTAEQAVYFDVASIRTVVLSPAAARLLGVLALLAGFVAWIRVVGVAYRQAGLAGLLRTVAWVAAGTILAASAIVGAAALLRAVREVYHPWYAHPGRFWLLLLLAGFTAARLLLSLERRLPKGARAVRHPALVWMLVLPAWLTLAAMVEQAAPSAAYLWTVPLLAAGAVVLVAARATGGWAQVAAMLVVAVSGGLWVPETRDLLRFAVPVLGRFPMLVPVAMLPAALIGGLVMIVPPLAAILAARTPPAVTAETPAAIRRLRALTVPSLLVALTAVFAWCYVGEAYTHERPLWRYVQYVADHASGAAVWEIAGNEPGLDIHLGRGAPSGWQAAHGPLIQGSPARPFRHPFSFRAATTLDPALVEARGAATPEGGDLRLEITATVTEGGQMVTFVLPPGVVPVRSSLPGELRDGWWTAAYAAAPAGVVSFTATVPARAAGQLGRIRVGLVSAALPGGTGWLRQPDWLGQERAVWYSRSLHLVPVTGLAQQPPLR